MLRQILTMTASDLRQRVRDRSVLIFGLVVPFGLMAVFNVVVGNSQQIELRPAAVSFSADAADPLAGVLRDTLGSLDGFEVTVTGADAEEVRNLAADGEVDLGVVVPEGFGDAVMAGEPATLEIVEGDGAGLEADVLISVIDGVLDRFTTGSETVAAATAAGVPPEQAVALSQLPEADGAVTLTEGRASSEQLSTAGALVAGQAGLFLLFTVGFGVLGLLAERDQGTLARLESMPLRRDAIVVAKGLVSFVLGVAATGVLLTVGSLMFGADLGNPVAVAVLVVCAVVAATSLMFVIIRVARTAEQAGIAQSILAMGLGVAGGAFFPMAASGVLGRVLDLNPVAALIRGLGITSGGGGVTDIGVPVVTMLGFAVVALLLSRLIPDRGAAS